MNAEQVMDIARKHLGKGAMVSSAKLCLLDAMECAQRSDYEHAKQRALKSISYSVGVFHPDYQKASV